MGSKNHYESSFSRGIGNSSLTGFYENHIKTGQELIEILNKEIQP